MAAAIKLLDDVLDLPEECGVSVSWARLLGPGAAAYALFLFSIAATLRMELAVALFTASYAIGMKGEFSLRTPVRLPSWLESVMAIMIGWAAGGVWLLLLAVATVAAVDLFDDVIDEPNAPRRTEKLLLSCAAVFAALALEPWTALCCLGAGWLFVGPLAYPPRSWWIEPNEVGDGS